MSEKNKEPQIKGIFVKSHIEALRREQGEEAVQKLSEKLGDPLDFKNLEWVPASLESAILEESAQMMADHAFVQEEREREAGRLHFHNFSTTPYGRILLKAYPEDFRKLMLGSPLIARHVFRNTEFSAEEMGERMIRVRIKNSGYPLAHFAGLFHEWMKYSGLRNPRVEAKEEDGAQVYTMQWDEWKT